MDDEELRKILHNREMIRERTLSSYEELLGIDITAMAEERVRNQGKFVWYDLCCGCFDAGANLKYRLDSRGQGDLNSGIVIVGIDADTYSEQDEVKGYKTILRRGNVVNYPFPLDVDLITCLRGLRYVEQYLGQGTQAVQHWYNSVPVGAVIAFDYNGDNSFLAERGDIYIKVQGVPLWQALQNQLGDAVKTSKNSNLKESAFAVTITKRDPRELRL
ncbi:MAG: hypothetical protein WCV90_01590 [Candidatus Woesearchaeota archaeon]